MLFSNSVPLSFPGVLAEPWFYIFDITFSASTLKKEKDWRLTAYTLRKVGVFWLWFLCVWDFFWCFFL